MISSYLDHLPAVLRQGDFLQRFLLAFEAILSGVDLRALDPEGRLSDEEKQLAGLDQLFDRINTFFDPDQAPEDFLPWLAQWVATSLRDDWNESTRREFIGNIVPLYRMRGTRQGIEEVLRLSSDPAKVVDFGDGLDEELEARAFGKDPKPPYLFGVILTVTERDPILLARKVRRVRAIVAREKPAHALYALRVDYPALRINADPGGNKARGPGVLVGRNTVLGTIKA